MNVQACIDLHNRIVEHAVSRLPPEKSVDVTRGYFNYFADESPESYLEMRDTLSPDLIRFLEGVDIVDYEKLPFLPHLQRLSSPSEMISDYFIEHPHLIALYEVIHREGEDIGLIYDMENDLCSFHQDIWRATSLQWRGLSLEAVLTRYWKDIVSGKFAFDPNADFEQQWRMEPYVPSDLQSALQNWDDYVDKLVEKLPVEQRMAALSIEKHYGWFMTAVLDEHNVSGFAREFVLSARKPPPPVKYIAPGLQILDIDTLAVIAQHRRDNPSIVELQESMSTFLLFPSQEPFVTWNSGTEQRPEIGWYYDKLVKVADKTGLYLLPVNFETARFADTAQLLTPWPVNGSNEEIFKYRSPCPYYDDHPPFLKDVLRKWKDILADPSGWTVGPEGVEGGMDAWKRAGTAERRMFELSDWCA